MPVVSPGVICNTGGLGPRGIRFARAVSSPEPASWNLVVLGFAGLGALKHRHSTLAAAPSANAPG